MTSYVLALQGLGTFSSTSPSTRTIAAIVSLVIDSAGPDTTHLWEPTSITKSYSYLPELLWSRLWRPSLMKTSKDYASEFISPKPKHLPNWQTTPHLNEKVFSYRSYFKIVRGDYCSRHTDINMGSQETWKIKAVWYPQRNKIILQKQIPIWRKSME